MEVRRSSGGAEVVLPADYVAHHVELGYATTAYRSQGRTVDTTHSMVSPTTTREVLYVAARADVSPTWSMSTRPSTQIPLLDTTARSRPRARARCSPACSPMRVRTSPRTRPLRGHNARPRTSACLPPSTRPLPAQLNSNAGTSCWVAQGWILTASSRFAKAPPTDHCLPTLRDAEARGLDVERTLPVLVEARSLDDAEDPAAVIRGRVERWGRAAGSCAASGHRPHRRADPTSGRRHGPRHGPGSRRAGRGDAAPGVGTGRAGHRAESGLGAPARHRHLPTRSPESIGSKPSRQLPLTGNAGTSTMTTDPSARKARRGRSKRSTSATSPRLLSTGHRGLLARPEGPARSSKVSLQEAAQSVDRSCKHHNQGEFTIVVWRDPWHRPAG